MEPVSINFFTNGISLATIWNLSSSGSSLIKLSKFGNLSTFSLVIKHLNFRALPPSDIPSLNYPSPPSMALVPS